MKLDPMKRLYARLIFGLVCFLLLSGCFTPRGEPLPPVQPPPPTDWPGPNRIDLWEKGKWFLSGTNYPWLHYGHDFGVASPWAHDGVSSQESKVRIDTDFSYLAKGGVHVARWFVFGDGRASPEFNAKGEVTGFDAQFYKDMDAALALAEKHNVYLIFVLLDYEIASEKQMSKEVQLGGRADLFLPEKRGSFFDNALKPLLERYGNHPNILAWEIINEPENAMRLPQKEKNPVETEIMRDFVREAVQYIHDYSSQQATIGSKSRKYLYLWTDSNVDFYQYHYYDRMEKDYPLDYPYADLNANIGLLNKPCIIGEFPTKSTERTLTEHLNIILKNGYAGGLAWSYGASDSFSDFSRITSEYTDWLKTYEKANRIPDENPLPLLIVKPSPP